MGEMTVFEQESLLSEYVRPALEKIGIYCMDLGGQCVFPKLDSGGNVHGAVVYFGRSRYSMDMNDWQEVELPWAR